MICDPAAVPLQPLVCWAPLLVFAYLTHQAARGRDPTIVDNALLMVMANAFTQSYLVNGDRSQCSPTGHA